MPIDPFTLEIHGHLFAQVTEEMGAVLGRAALSPNVRDRRDYSCAVFDARGEMIAQAAHIPVHLGAAPLSVQAVIAALELGPGEHALVNDPYAGGTHLPDLTLVSPVFLGSGDRPRLYVANRAHHADVGGHSPGSMGVATRLEDEGIVIPPSRLDDALIERFLERARGADERLADLRAQVAANEAGMARLREIAANMGEAAMLAAASDLVAYSEARTRSTIATMPRGSFAFRDVLDDDGAGTRDIGIAARIVIDGQGVVIDLRESHDEVEGNVNAPRAIAVSAAFYVMRALLDRDVPTNGGVLRAIDLRTRRGSVVDATAPRAVAGGNVETSQRIVDVLLGALAMAMPDRIPAASQGTMNNVAFGGERADGSSWAFYETLAGGAGASPNGPGRSGVHTHMTNTRNTPVEVLERAYPLRIVRYGLRRGSGGAGRHRGGDGIVREYELGEPATISLLGERRRHAPWGLSGGRAGARGADWLVRGRTGRIEPIPAKCTLALEPGDRVIVETPGGGGWGCP
ncbi:MAG: hydantoinase B/oxoprolinase family protein [Deltaproteobacteria bacterium]|nr:hydantoinase B/oxoprolinase family protein [Deltaproteobacteria bacterium]